MGTRNLTCVVLDKQIKVAQYGQWDGYPEGAGATVFEFINDCLKEDDGLKLFKDKVSSIKEENNEDLEDKWVKAGHERGKKLVSFGVSNTFKKEFPHLHRSMGASVLAYIFKNDVKSLKNEVSFAKDSLFCEWGYVLDLDNLNLEVYEGFQEVSHSKGRFAAPNPNTHGYFPIKLIHTFSFSELRNMSEKDFVQKIYDNADS